MSYTPAQDEKEKRTRKETVELCGKNRGVHHYIPIEWAMTEQFKRVTRLMCLVCFSHVSVYNLMQVYPEIIP